MFKPRLVSLRRISKFARDKWTPFYVIFCPQAKANKDVQNANLQSPLHLAVERQHTQIVRVREVLARQRKCCSRRLRELSRKGSAVEIAHMSSDAKYKMLLAAGHEVLYTIVNAVVSSSKAENRFLIFRNELLIAQVTGICEI